MVTPVVITISPVVNENATDKYLLPGCAFSTSHRVLPVYVLPVYVLPVYV